MCVGHSRDSCSPGRQLSPAAPCLSTGHMDPSFLHRWLQSVDGVTGS